MNDSQKWLMAVLAAGLGWLIYRLAPVLTPFVAGALLAYLTDPLADRLERAGLKRTTAVVAVFSAVLLIAALIVLVIAPMLELQVSHLVDRLPTLNAWMKSSLSPWLRTRFGAQIKIANLDQLTSLLAQAWQDNGGIAANIFNSVTHSGAVVVTWLMNVLLIPVVTFYLLRDWDVMIARIYDLLPRRYAPIVAVLAGEADQVLSAFFRGQFSVMLALGAIYSFGLWIVDLDLALLVGMVAGLVSFIPYMGAATGMLTGCIAAIAQFGTLWSCLPVLAVFGVGQLIEGTVLTPKLVGNRIGLHPVAVIFAVLAGGQLFGFFGVLVALPAAAVIMVMMRHLHDWYKDSPLYGSNAEQKERLENSAGD
jgi:predicted PurR-regulated permease PerM